MGYLISITNSTKTYGIAGEKVPQYKLCTPFLPEGNDCSQSKGYAGDMDGGHTGALFSTDG